MTDLPIDTSNPAVREQVSKLRVPIFSSIYLTAEPSVARNGSDAQQFEVRLLEGRKSNSSTRGVNSPRFSSTVSEQDSSETPEPKAILRDLLSSLKDLDLTTRIRYSTEVLKAHGGYSDIFIGCFIGGTAKLAVKRIRIHTHGDYDFAKVLSLYPESFVLLQLMALNLIESGEGN